MMPCGKRLPSDTPSLQCMEERNSLRKSNKPNINARAFSDLIELTLSPCHSGESRSPVAFRGFWIPGQARNDGL